MNKTIAVIIIISFRAGFIKNNSGKISLKVLGLRLIERVHRYLSNYPPLFPKEGAGGVLSCFLL